ncbi:MAG: GyrI-like domain-containing protein [bacterium]
MNDTLARVQRAIDLVETRLADGELPLEQMAGAAAFSPWHFHSVFAALTGETPAAYVRKRRLSEICRRLLETDTALVDVALDMGFESQATFTRAFTRHVGTSPGRYRRQRLLSPAHRYAPLDLAQLAARHTRGTMQPRIARKTAFHVIGLAGRFTPATQTQIPALWGRFVPLLERVPQRRDMHTLGLCVDADPGGEEAGFTYVAGVEVERLDQVPDGLMALTVPTNTYAVFTHSGHISRLSDTVRQIWGRWLPASPYRHIAAPDFEWYDERWDPQSGEGDVDIYVPIADA